MVSLLSPVTYCVSVSIYNYDCLILYEWFSLESIQYELDNSQVPKVLPNESMSNIDNGIQKNMCEYFIMFHNNTPSFSKNAKTNRQNEAKTIVGSNRLWCLI